MFKYILIIILFLSFVSHAIYAGDESATVEIVLACTTYSDFADVIPEIDASAHYHWFVTCGARSYKWNGSSYVQVGQFIDVYNDGPYDGYDHNWSISDEEVHAEHLGEFNNG